MKTHEDLTLSGLVHDLNNVFQTLVDAADLLSGDPRYVRLSAAILRSVERGKNIASGIQAGTTADTPFETILANAIAFVEDSVAAMHHVVVEWDHHQRGIRHDTAELARVERSEFDWLALTQISQRGKHCRRVEVLRIQFVVCHARTLSPQCKTVFGWNQEALLMRPHPRGQVREPYVVSEIVVGSESFRAQCGLPPVSIKARPGRERFR